MPLKILLRYHFYGMILLDDSKLGKRDQLPFSDLQTIPLEFDSYRDQEEDDDRDKDDRDFTRKDKAVPHNVPDVEG